MCTRPKSGSKPHFQRQTRYSAAFIHTQLRQAQVEIPTKPTNSEPMLRLNLIRVQCQIGTVHQDSRIKIQVTRKSLGHKQTLYQITLLILYTTAYPRQGQTILNDSLKIHIISAKKKIFFSSVYAQLAYNYKNICQINVFAALRKLHSKKSQ